MNFDKETRPAAVPREIGDVLSEAMPWFKKITGTTVLIKYGGAAMENAELRAQVMADIVLLKIIGVKPVIVHGGGKEISAAMERSGLPVEFIDGQRVTSDEAMDLVRMILAGRVNQELVAAMNEHGTMAVGLSGADAHIIVAEQADPRLGRVGSIKRINSGLIEDLAAGDYIPVIATVAVGEDGGYYNVNADVAAGHIAAAIGAHKILFLTDVDGLYLDYGDPETLISKMTLHEARSLMADGTISKGMIPKLNACVTALDSGVHRAHIINGTVPHAILLELLTDKGIGTMIKPDEESVVVPASPVDNFAQKLKEHQ